MITTSTIRRPDQKRQPHSLTPILYLLYSVQLDCFKFQTSVVFLRQRDSVQFDATPSADLAGNEKTVCEETINNQRYNLTVQLGDYTFGLSSLTYNSGKSISLTLPCTSTSCSFTNIKTIQVAVYKMYFPDTQLTLQSIVDNYQLRIFNHKDCQRGVNMKYDLKKREFNFIIGEKVVECPNDLATTNGDMNITYIDIYLNGERVFSEGYSTGNFSQRIKLSGSPESIDKDYWQKIDSIGDFQSQDFAQGDAVLTEMVQNVFSAVKVEIPIMTEVKQVRNGNNAPSKSFYYNQSTNFYVSNMENGNQDDCFESVTIQLFKTFWVVKAEYDEDATKCTDSHIVNQIGEFDDISFMLYISENADRSRYNYNVTFDIPGYRLGESIDYQLNCRDEGECEAFGELNTVVARSSNASINMQQMFMKDGNILLRSKYAPTLQQEVYESIEVMFTDDRLCVVFQPIADGSRAVQITINDYVFSIAVFVSVGQQLYCEKLGTQAGNLGEVISEISGETDILSNSKVVINSVQVGTVSIMLYTLPEQYDVAWVPLGISSAAFVVLSGVFMFRC